MKPIDFPEILQQMSRMEEEKQTRIIVGGQIHEIFKICETNDLDPYEFVGAF